MQTRFVLYSFLPAALAACSSTSPDRAGDSNLNGAKIEVSAQGGIAALTVNHVVNHDSRAFAYTLRHLCDKNCGAAIDSTSGTLAGTATDSLFNIVLSQERLVTKDDYGTTQGGADMMTYTVRITADGTVRTILFDDGNTPDPMRRILEAVRGIVAAATPPK